MSLEELERAARVPEPVYPEGFNRGVDLPYGLTVEHVQRAMQEYVDFLGLINGQLHTKQFERLEAMLMPANFSSMVGEFMNSGIPKHCPTLVKNRYHNGHPDLLPAGRYEGDAAQHGTDGIEVKGSRDTGGWQGHNPEKSWLMIFVFDSNRPADILAEVPPRPFRFLAVLCAQMELEDWNFSGRSDDSRRTPTAGTDRSGTAKLRKSWIYRAPGELPRTLLL
jgi:hypothetical protein